ncbi:MAG: hypothetical protein GF309_14435 [Candidatus Lokiarchaeota archaeon]|jgi:hypothetical protein|nr:hypothetical protein [Candidatus Lokiarchaeota archaeon]
MGSKLEEVISKYEKKLNSSPGDSVLEYLNEGESFLIDTSDYLLRVTKRNGRAEVALVEIPVP